VGASLIAEGSRYNEIGNTNELGGYGLVNLWGEYALSQGLTVKAQVDNLFDKDYQTSLNYNQPGTEVFVSLDYRFR
ncbi:MAG: TonB-dependent receptor, partial [Candidatus Competibacteraceae bacterium]|nr:TonB-dependent receptor [Candidatus Competibacteraceae bacterium]